MMAHKDPDTISKIFNRFAGKEIAIIYKKHLNRRNTFASWTEFRVDETDPVARELKQAANDAGMELKLCRHREGFTKPDPNPDRLNVHVGRGADLKWRISSFH